MVVAMSLAQLKARLQLEVRGNPAVDANYDDPDDVVWYCIP